MTHHVLTKLREIGFGSSYIFARAGRKDAGFDVGDICLTGATAYCTVSDAAGDMVIGDT